MKTEHKSFRVDVPFPIDKKGKKWWQFRKMDRVEYGRTAINYTLIGLVFSFIFPALSVFTLFGLVCGLIWLFLRIRLAFNSKTHENI